jgi:Ca-activated chloride channel family protein
MPELNAFDLTQLHFLRPWWLAAIPCIVIAIYYLWRQQSKQSGWQSIINPDLLSHLLQGENKGENAGINRLSLIGLAIIWLLACTAIAGPSWEKIPQPIHKSEQAVIILLDLSPSMKAEDIKPSRMIRARLKLIDLLKLRKEGLTALVAFAGEAHTITPLTDDTKTIVSLVPSLSPSIMPLAGSNPEMAIDIALSLFTEAGINQGDVILITDGIAPAAADYITNKLGPEYSLSILGVGTDKGAPIPIESGGFAKDKQGNIVLARLDSSSLYSLSRNSGGDYQTLTATDTDIKILNQITDKATDQTRQLDREFDLWLDRGPWLLLPLIPLLLLCFRRGWLLSLVFIVLIPMPDSTYAANSINAATPNESAENTKSDTRKLWNNLWQTSDQQGKNLLKQGDASNAAKVFKDKQWAATAHYQANEYQQAADLYNQDKTADGHYNQGNALAMTGQFEAAIAAYDLALKQNPEFEDAKFNKVLIEKLKQEQEQEQQQKQEQQDSDQQDKSDQQSQESSENSEQNSEQSDSESEQKDQKSDSDSDSEQQSDQEQQSPNDSDSKKKEKQQEDDQAAKQGEPDETENEQENEARTAEETQVQPNSEQQQAMEQWLRKIPDDPSGLMRKKFEHQYYQRRKQYQDGTWQPPQNDAINRW